VNCTRQYGTHARTRQQQPVSRPVGQARWLLGHLPQWARPWQAPCPPPPWRRGPGASPTGCPPWQLSRTSSPAPPPGQSAEASGGSTAASLPRSLAPSSLTQRVTPAARAALSGHSRHDRAHTAWAACPSPRQPTLPSEPTCRLGTPGLPTATALPGPAHLGNTSIPTGPASPCQHSAWELALPCPSPPATRLHCGSCGALVYRVLP
jgi:hypothetical protein